MVDALAVTSAISALKQAVDIAGALLSERDKALVQARVQQLNELLIAAQRETLASYSEQLDLLKAKRELEEQIAQFKTWETEKQRYELQEIGEGFFAYALKESARGAEPMHYICTPCYQRGQKMILQWTNTYDGGRPHQCPQCKFVIVL